MIHRIVGSWVLRITVFLYSQKSRSDIEPETLLRQAGEARLREIITAAGFRNLRHAAETPFSMILEPDLELTRPAGHMARPG